MTGATTDGVTVNWDSAALKAKGVVRVSFTAISSDPKEKPFIVSYFVGHNSTLIRSLKPSTLYRLTVDEGQLDDPAIEIGAFVTLPLGNDRVNYCDCYLS